jgi:hypothetical protein
VSRTGSIRNNKSAHRGERTKCIVTAWRGQILPRGHITIHCACLRRHVQLSALHGQNMGDGQKPHQEGQAHCYLQKPYIRGIPVHNKTIIARAYTASLHSKSVLIQIT